MNTAEKIAYTYLRLNGFLLLPHFTVFGGGAHSHVDLIGLRAADSFERFGQLTFPMDDELFHHISEMIGEPLRQHLGVVAEVRTNANRDIPNDEQVEYIRRFLGETPIIKLAFYDGLPFYREGDFICVGIRHTLRWIVGRIEWMEQRMPTNMTKTGSWNWSDEYLSDFLVLCRYGFLHNDRQ
jgi:hypothetical protein